MSFFHVEMLNLWRYSISTRQLSTITIIYANDDEKSKIFSMQIATINSFCWDTEHIHIYMYTVCKFLIRFYYYKQNKTKHARAYEFCETIYDTEDTPHSVPSRYIYMDDSIVSAFKFKLNKWNDFKIYHVAHLVGTRVERSVRRRLLQTTAITTPIRFCENSICLYVYYIYTE